MLPFQRKDIFLDLCIAGGGITFVVTRNHEATFFQHADGADVVFGGAGIQRAHGDLIEE